MSHTSFLEEIEKKIKKGKDLEEAARDFSWQDFEAAVSEVLSANGFRIFRNFRFSSNKRRFEIDVIAISKPRIMLIDCKHWGIRLGKTSAIRSAATAQTNRSAEFSKKLAEFVDFGLEEWKDAIIIPLILTLYQEQVVENDGSVVVPFFKLNSFIEESRNGIFDFKVVKVGRITSW
ncbi:MAG: NERD domain-containing protein [Candidatus Methanomethylicus sp.]|nr:NERD domain-containing protein [Candidatus Methanomethylicus sp.]